MSLTVECPGCHLKIQLPESAAGKRGKCRQCGATVVIPKHSAAVPTLAKCSDCGGLFTYDQVIEFGGNITCRHCVAAHRDRKLTMQLPLSALTTASATTPSANSRRKSPRAAEKKASFSILRVMITLGSLGFLCSCCICTGIMCSSDDPQTHPPNVSQFDLTHDKAEEMRDRVFNGTDDELAKMHDRIKDDEDAKRFRRERLGDN